MKILSISVFEPGKAGEVAKVLDKVIPATPGYKPLAMYVCLGNPFPGTIPPNSMVGITIAEVENENALAAVSYPLALAGMNVHRVPVLEMKAGQSAETEKKLRGA
jgi:hypothetical protein